MPLSSAEQIVPMANTAINADCKLVIESSYMELAQESGADTSKRRANTLKSCS